MGFEVVATPGPAGAGPVQPGRPQGQFGLHLRPDGPEIGRGGATSTRTTRAREIFDYLKGAIEAAGGTMADICKVNVFLTDGSQVPALTELRPQYFDKPYPAATTVVVNRLFRPELAMEIEAIAVLD